MTSRVEKSSFSLLEDFFVPGAMLCNIGSVSLNRGITCWWKRSSQVLFFVVPQLQVDSALEFMCD